MATIKEGDSIIATGGNTTTGTKINLSEQSLTQDQIELLKLD